jgi:hypothetical protein
VGVGMSDLSDEPDELAPINLDVPSRLTVGEHRPPEPNYWAPSAKFLATGLVITMAFSALTRVCAEVPAYLPALIVALIGVVAAWDPDAKAPLP